MSRKPKTATKIETELFRNFIIDIFANIFYHKAEAEHIDPDLL